MIESKSQRRLCCLGVFKKTKKERPRTSSDVVEVVLAALTNSWVPSTSTAGSTLGSEPVGRPRSCKTWELQKSKHQLSVPPGHIMVKKHGQQSQQAIISGVASLRSDFCVQPAIAQHQDALQADYATSRNTKVTYGSYRKHTNGLALVATFSLAARLEGPVAS